MIVKLLTDHHLEFLSLKGGCRGRFESTLVKMPHCWKSHGAAHIIINLQIRVTDLHSGLPISCSHATKSGLLTTRLIISPYVFLIVVPIYYFQLLHQAFRFMVGPGHCLMISKDGPSLFKEVGPVDPSFLVVKKSHFNKKYSSYSKSRNYTKIKVHVGCQYSKTC